MKIGILTFHRSVNNGAVMQAYSLSKKLKNEFEPLGIEVEIIDYHMPKEDDYCVPSFRNSMKGVSNIIRLKRIYRFLQNPSVYKQQRKRIQVFREAFTKLPLSEEFIYENSTEYLFRYIDENYDAVIVGSDAVWNYKVLGFPNPYFLSSKIKAKKYTYAASVYGMNYERIPEHERRIIGNTLNTYEMICTRDGESEKFIADMGCHLQPVHTCDPTVFLDINGLPINEEEIKRKLTEKGFDFNRKTIGVMGSERMCEMVRGMYGRQYQIVALYNYCVNADVNLYDFSPFEWAYVFRFFEVTFTTFFHGTLVSLRNATPVIACGLVNDYSEKHMTKVEDFLIRIGMHDCYFNTDYRTKAIHAIKKKTDYFLSHNMRAYIEKKMNIEAQTFNPFLERLKADIAKETKV